MPMLAVVQRRKTVEMAWTSDDSYVKLALQWTDTRRPQRKRATKNTRKRYLENLLWSADFKHSWKKIKGEAQNGAGWIQVICGYVPLGVTKYQVLLFGSLSNYISCSLLFQLKRVTRKSAVAEKEPIVHR